MTIALTAPMTLAANAKKPSAEAPAKKKKVVQHSVDGKIKAVDKTSMTITVEGKLNKQHVVHINSQTRMTKVGKPATLNDATVGESLNARVVKSAAGTEDAVSIRLGLKAKVQPAKKKGVTKAKAKNP
ncbi:MAG: hypothetical protein EXS30_00510 [Pedosphaera sp.]|nr:hypothetical protein [Pedosphaera sp.]